ncbi:MAG: FHA domain-containing protein, partial [Candidatus Promineifilaceae bacterium]
SENNTIVLEDAFVSAEHALLARRDAQWWLEDLNSRNGTLLNDLPLGESTVVSAGDVITIGSVQLKIEPSEVSG